MLITDDSEWIMLNPSPTNVVTTSSLSISSTSTLTHRNTTGDHTKDATATATATATPTAPTATTTTSTSTTTTTDIPLPISDLAPRIRHLIDTWQTCENTWKHHKQHRIPSCVRTSMQQLHTWFHHTSTRIWQQITGWLYVPYLKLCDGFFYFILIGVYLVSFISLTHGRISLPDIVEKALTMMFGFWIIMYILLMPCLIMGNIFCMIRSWWCPSVYVIPIQHSNVIPYNRTTLTLFLALICITLHPLSSIPPFNNHYAPTIIRTLLICICGFPVWRGWYDVRCNMETLHIYYTGMGDITRLQVKYMETQQHVQHQQSNEHPDPQHHARQEQQTLRAPHQLNPTLPPPSSTVTSPNPIPTTTFAAFALFLSQLRHSCSSSSSSSPTPSPSHVTLCHLHLTTWLTCLMMGVYSIVVCAFMIGNDDY